MIKGIFGPTGAIESNTTMRSEYTRAAFTFLHGHIQYSVLLFTGLTAIAFVPAAVAVTQDVVHPGLRAVSLSLCVIVQHLLGSALGPSAIGMLSDNYGLETALKFLPCLTFLGSILFFAAAFFYERDFEIVEKVEIIMQTRSHYLNQRPGICRVIKNRKRSKNVLYRQQNDKTIIF